MADTPNPSLPTIPPPTQDPASLAFVMTQMKQRIENITAYLLALKT